jgi:hypothetical protein
MATKIGATIQKTIPGIVTRKALLSLGSTVDIVISKLGSETRKINDAPKIVG